MLVSYRHEFIFVKTRKTAGSAVELAFEPFVRSPDAAVSGTRDSFATAQCVTRDGIIGARSQAFKEKATYFDHMQARDIRRMVGADVWSRFFKFCTIRNPWDKTVSAFYFARPAVREKTVSKQIEIFRAWLGRDDVRKLRDRDIYYIKDRPAMDDYIRFHRLSEDVERIADKLRLPVENLPEIHRQSRNRAIAYADFYDDSARERVADMYRCEIADFGWRFEGDEDIAFPKPSRLPVQSELVGRLGAWLGR
ncbi:hypothetical protein RDV64_16825 [Acuticoccus sp. MNP-M23]|uniref:hypothetical protein n=1 Tax=Acuticoccus sp. MNP-M23 TaxID=3072793 RepID=UPI0028155F90|nr:hypothetical protein [Acuticoccus sp. MNP-M23]WMS41721.1 hypothetical protein RDV64_16825 [Acuticoccus sp. MNP-M23]